MARFRVRVRVRVTVRVKGLAAGAAGVDGEVVVGVSTVVPPLHITAWPPGRVSISLWHRVRDTTSAGYILAGQVKCSRVG